MATTIAPRFLLLLPPLPSEQTFSSCKTAFDKTVAEVLKEVAAQSEPHGPAAILEIALACPHLVGHLNSPRESLYDQTQTQIALLYKLVVVIANRDNINVEDDSGVDVRIIPVAWVPGGDNLASGAPGYGPLVTLITLARSGRPWQFAFGVESEEGERMVDDFVRAKGEADIGLSLSTGPPKQHAGETHHDVAVGGTFDHLHIGHKLLLSMTLFAADPLESGGPPSITIGITGDELLKNKKYAEVLQSWDTRQRKIEEFCDGMLDFTSWPSQKAVDDRHDDGPNGRSVNLVYGNGMEVKCTQIQDPFGPTITNRAISALVISAETRSGGSAVNEKRREKGWPELHVYEVDVLDADEDGVERNGFEMKLSSTAIRQKLASSGS